MLMTCVNNTGYEDCLTLGKKYEVEVEYIEGSSMKKVLDDSGEPLQTMLDRFA